MIQFIVRIGRSRSVAPHSGPRPLTQRNDRRSSSHGAPTVIQCSRCVAGRCLRSGRAALKGSQDARRSGRSRVDGGLRADHGSGGTPGVSGLRQSEAPEGAPDAPTLTLPPAIPSPCRTAKPDDPQARGGNSYTGSKNLPIQPEFNVALAGLKLINKRLSSVPKYIQGTGL